MKIFNPVNREYTNPVDLNTLGSTFNTLEQGHKEAVKAASDLEIVLANLDLNEAESEWRQQRLSEIRQTVADNTNHGNAYGALDDVISKAGNIASDPGMIGRLNAQKEFKQWETELNNRGDIGEDMKEMYRETNPYSYEDIVNPETGAVTGGTRWQPTSRPVSTVDMYRVMNMALQNAAAESGGGESITFLDANGNATSDYRKSHNGEMFMKSGSTYKRLTEDKIKQSIEAAIEATPGARASLEQDYKLATWKHGKSVRESGDTPQIIPGTTDKFGNLFSYDQFIENKITPFAASAAYNHISNSSQLGTALSTYRAEQKAAAQQAIMAQQDLERNFRFNTSGANTVGTVDTEIDNYSTTVNGRNNTNAAALGIIGKYTPEMGNKFTSVSDFIQAMRPESGSYGPGIAVSNYIQQLRDRGVDISREEISQLNNAVRAYTQYNKEVGKIESGLSADDKRALRFSANVSNGEFKAGDSKYDDAIINLNNEIWSNNDRVNIQVSDNLATQLIRQYGVSRLSDIGFSIENINGMNNIVVKPEDRNMLPDLINKLDIADKEVGASWRGILNTVKSGRNKDYIITGTKDGRSGFEQGLRDTRIPFVSNAIDNIRYSTSNNILDELDIPSGASNLNYQMNKMRQAYSNGVKRAASVQERAGVNTGVLSLEAYGSNNFKTIELQDRLDRGDIEQSYFNEAKSRAESTVDAMLATTSFDAGKLYNAETGNHFERENSPQEMQQLIAYMYQNHANKVARQVIVPTGIADERRGDGAPMKGYIMSFTVPNDNATKELFGKTAGKSFKVFYGGSLEEGTSADPALSTSSVVHNVYNTSRASQTPASLLDYDSHLGNTDVVFENGQPYINFAGRTSPTSPEAAIHYMKVLYNIGDFKTMVHQQGGIDFDLLNQYIGKNSYEISLLTGQDIGVVQGALLNYINDGRK